MKAQTLFVALALAGLFVVCPAGVVVAQDPAAVDPQDIVVFPSLTQLSRDAVEVWRLTCTSTPLFFAQVARARISDRGGADGRLLYLHLKRQTTGATAKATAPDGGTSGFVSVGSGGAGSVYFIEVSKDRNGAVLLGIPIAEPYTLQAECFAGGIVRPHTLVLSQNR